MVRVTQHGRTIQRLLASAREKRVRIIYVRYTKHAEGSSFSDAIRRNAFRGEPGGELDTIEGAPGWEVIDAVKPQPEDLVLRKYRPDAFYGSILDSVLRWNGVKTVVVVGLGARWALSRLSRPRRISDTFLWRSRMR